MGERVSILMDLVYFILDTAVLFGILQSILKYKEEKYPKWLCVVLLYAVYLSKYATGYFPEAIWRVPFVESITGIYIYVAFFAISIVFFQGKISTKVFSIGIYLTLVFIVEMALIIITMTVFGKTKSEIMNNEAVFYLELGCSKIVELFAVFLFRIFRAKNREEKFIRLNFEIGMILMVDFVAILLGAAMVRYSDVWFQKVEQYIVIFLIAVFSISLLSVILIVELLYRMKREMQFQVAVETMALEKEYNVRLQEAEKNLRSLRHDMNNHINVMKGLLYMEEYGELEQYFSEIDKEAEYANEIVILDNKPLSILLQQKIAEAKKHGITLELEVSKDKIAFPSSELCALVGNILDNALEAVKKVSAEKCIYFLLRQKENIIEIECENPYAEKPMVKDGMFITTKSNKKLHGLGVKKIRDIVEKYHGWLKIQYEETFFVYIELPVNGNQKTSNQERNKMGAPVRS